MDGTDEDAELRNRPKSNQDTGYVLGGSSSSSSGSELRNRVENGYNSQDASTSTSASSAGAKLPSNFSEQSNRNNNSIEHNVHSFSQLSNNNPSQTPPSVRPSAGIHADARPPSPPRRPMPVNNNNTVTENFYQFQIRCILFLACAIVIGYMYIQIESNQSLIKYKLIPDSYGGLSSNRRSVKTPSNYKSSPSSPSPSPSVPPPQAPPEPEPDESVSMISPEYKLHAEYLSRVLKSLGDLTKQYETNSNGSLLKPVGGIVEMKAEYKVEEEEEDEEKNVPDYMKTLGSIINDIKKSKVGSKNVKKFRFKKQQQTPDGIIKNNQKKVVEDDNEWTDFVNELVSAAYKMSRDENEEGGDIDVESEFDLSKILGRSSKYVKQTNKDDVVVKDKHNNLKTSNDAVDSDDSENDIVDLGEEDPYDDDDSLFNEEFDHFEDNIDYQKNSDSSLSSSTSKQEKIQERLKFLEKLFDASTNEDFIVADKTQSVTSDGDEDDSSSDVQFKKNEVPDSTSSSDKVYKEHETTTATSTPSRKSKDDGKTLLQDDNLYTLD